MDMVKVYDSLMSMASDRAITSVDGDVKTAYQEISDVLHDRMVVGEPLSDEQCEMLRHYNDVLQAFGGEPDDIDGALMNYREMVDDAKYAITAGLLN